MLEIVRFKYIFTKEKVHYLSFLIAMMKLEIQNHNIYFLYLYKRTSKFRVKKVIFV